MKLQFSDDRFREYAVGNAHFKNDGEPFDVAPGLGAELLKAEASLGGELVKVFREADPEPETPTAADAPQEPAAPAKAPARKPAARKAKEK